VLTAEDYARIAKNKELFLENLSQKTKTIWRIMLNCFAQQFDAFIDIWESCHF